MASSPLTSKSDLVSFSIKSNGSPIKDTYQVLSAYVKRSVNEIPYCEIEISDGSAAKQDFPISNSDTFVPGNEIELLAGYENDNKTIFKGIVIKHRIRICSQSGPVLVILCKDQAVKMTIGRKNASFKNMKDSDVISKLIANNGLTTDVSPTKNSQKELVQYYSTDWDFILTRADTNGMIAIVQDGKVSIKNPNELKTVYLSLTYGLDIYEFDAEIDAQTQISSVKANAWDMKTQAMISSESTISNVDIGNLSSKDLAKVIGLDSFDLQTGAAIDKEMLSSWATAKTTKSAYAKIRGMVKFQGSALALPGTLIDFKGLGDRFNGNGFVSGVIHDIRDGNWITTAQIGLSPEWFESKLNPKTPSAAGLLPSISGLQVGIVKQINDDPDKQFRVLITLPLIQSNNEGIWARLTSDYASTNAGAFFYPEVDDEVIVGFLNDDPRQPVILGSVYSSARPAPETPDEKNNVKAFVSREQMKISFDEDEKVITITTPNENEIVFSDEDQGIRMKDQNGNFIQLSSDGIEINSASNVKITAADSVSIDGPTGITATASMGSIDLSGMNISCTADIEFSASADASTSISASAELSISGAMVLINS